MTQPDLVSKLRELSANWPHNQRRHGDLTWVCRATCQRCELESLLGREGQAAPSKWCAKYGGLYDGDYCGLCDCELKRPSTCGPSQPELSPEERHASGLEWAKDNPADAADLIENLPNILPSPSTPIVPSTPDDPRFDGVVVEVAEEFAILEEDIPTLRGILARIRKDVLREAEQVVKKWNYMACSDVDGLVEAIRAIAERPAPAGEARISRWQCPHCAHVNSMISANCENCKIPLVNTAR